MPVVGRFGAVERSEMLLKDLTDLLNQKCGGKTIVFPLP